MTSTGLIVIGLIVGAMAVLVVRGQRTSRPPRAGPTDTRSSVPRDQS